MHDFATKTGLSYAGLNCFFNASDFDDIIFAFYCSRIQAVSLNDGESFLIQIALPPISPDHKSFDDCIRHHTDANHC